MEYKLVTGANDFYILTLLNFINNYIEMGLNLKNLVIYDLGLNTGNLQKIQNLLKCNNNIKKLNYDEYPEHVDLKKYNGLFCSYAFKPIIMYNECNTDNNIITIWLDCACKITIISLKELINTILKQGFYCPIGNYEKTIETIELNHPQTINLLGITQYQHYNELQTRLACICGVLYNNFNGKTILDEWYKYSLIKDIIIPINSSRNNHRQDQTVLSCIMFLHEKKYDIEFEKSSFNISSWNKVDKLSIENNYYKFGLFKKYRNTQLAIIYATTLDEAIKIYYTRKNILSTNFLNEFYVLQL